MQASSPFEEHHALFAEGDEEDIACPIFQEDAADFNSAWSHWRGRSGRSRRAGRTKASLRFGFTAVTFFHVIGCVGFGSTVTIFPASDASWRIWSISSGVKETLFRNPRR